MDYNFQAVEQKWRKQWADQNIFKTEIDNTRPKCYVLDMFPYPSGAGLHVGHPLGYIASDIYARYKRLKGYNVLHPMGYDAFGLPAEQYAIQTGQHPKITTEENIARYRDQLDKIGFSFEWDREIRTSDPNYYKWTQWIFGLLFKSWFNNETQKAEPIEVLVALFEKEGNANVDAANDQTEIFSAEEWNSKSEKEKALVLLNYRLAYQKESMVNWCPALGTVLANDEVINGLSERGGHPVEKKMMLQWSLRISAYAERLLQGLEEIDWTDALKDTQRNWIGRSDGASLKFQIAPSNSPKRGEPDVSWQTAGNSTWEELKKRSEKLRKNPTEAENILWEVLRGRKLEVKFRRQHVIGRNIVDFVCLEKKLVIEVDGKIHDNQKEYDNARTEELNQLGFQVIRFKNEEVIGDIDNTIDKINKSLQSKNPPLSGETEGAYLEVFTTRPDTIFGVSFMVIAPEHELVGKLTSDEQKSAVESYVAAAKNKSERERMADVKNVTGVFTGSYAIHPFTGKEIPIWIGDYVLAGYGTGAVMAVAAHDSRDYAFAKQFDLPILPVIEGGNIEEEAYEAKSGKVINSDFLDGLKVKQAIKTAIWKIESEGLGKGQTNYRLRDAIFGRQRYWGEPIPIWYDHDGIPNLLEGENLPLELPEVDEYLPTEDGDPPLGRAKDWTPENGSHYELSTMPGWAGSSWYYLRYMDPQNDGSFVSKEASDYWNQVDLYIGGTEHATGHLLYSRFWCKVLFDLGYIAFDEPFKKLINQGMILGESAFAYRIKGEQKFVSFGLKDDYDTTPVHVDVNMVKNDILDIEAFKQWRSDFENAEFILEGDKYIVGHEVEKMSKSKFNVVNPDTIVEEHGADVLRMYEMFLGPLEQSKPWSTKGIDGVSRFIRKFWNLFHDGDGNFTVVDAEATKEELKVLHQTIKKVQEDIENFSFNTSISAFMVATNELGKLKCNKRSILEPMAILISSYAPFIAEELWNRLGNEGTIINAQFPEFNAEHLKESSIQYPVSFNGKMRFKLELPADLSKEAIEQEVLKAEESQKWLEGKDPKKVIVVPKKIVNIVV
jgi:leucyl-tRNA synthetase